MAMGCLEACCTGAALVEFWVSTALRVPGVFCAGATFGGWLELLWARSPGHAGAVLGGQLECSCPCYQGKRRDFQQFSAHLADAAGLVNGVPSRIV